MIQDNSFSKMTGIGLDVWDSVPDRGRDFAVFAAAFRLALRPTCSPVQCLLVLFHWR